MDQAISLSDLQTLAKNAEFPKRMIKMTDALPDMPAYMADADLIKKIRHGKMIATHDLIGHNSDENTWSPASYIKIVDLAGELIAILNHNKIRQGLDYCCVFPEQGT
jgi:tRNA U55 pseudouridine synthase TruB